jgi:hypothetical protein
MVTVIISSTEPMWATYAILDSNRVTGPLIVCTKFVEREGRNCLSTSYSLKNMKALVANTIGDMRHVLVIAGDATCHVWQWHHWQTLLTVSCHTYHFLLQHLLCNMNRPTPSVPVLWFVDGCGREASDSSKNDCRLSRSSVLSSSQFVTQTSKHKATDVTGPQDIYKLSHIWAIVLNHCANR